MLAIVQCPQRSASPRACRPGPCASLFVVCVVRVFRLALCSCHMKHPCGEPSKRLQAAIRAHIPVLLYVLVKGCKTLVQSCDLPTSSTLLDSYTSNHEAPGQRGTSRNRIPALLALDGPPSAIGPYMYYMIQYMYPYLIF